MTNRLPPSLIAVLVILVLAVAGLGIDRLTRISEADLIATVEQRIAIAGTDANVPATFEAQATDLSAQNSAMETQIAEDADERANALSLNIASAVSDTSSALETQIAVGIGDSADSIETQIAEKVDDSAENLQTQIAMAVTAENIGATVTAQGAQVLTQVAEFYPSETPTLTPSNTPTPTVTAFRLPDSNVFIRNNALTSDAIALAPSGRELAYSNLFDDIIIASIDTGNIVATFVGGDEDIVAIAWSPDGQFIISGGEQGQLNVWDVFTRELILELDTESPITDLAWASDSDRFAVGTFGGVQIWSVEQAELLIQQSGRANSVDWSDDLIVLALQTELVVYEITDNSLEQQTTLEPGLLATRVRFAPDGQSIVAIFENEDIVMWDRDGEFIWGWNDPNGVQTDVAWSPDSRFVVSPTLSSVIIWDAQSGELVSSSTTENIESIAWSLEGDRIIALNADVIQIPAPEILNIQPLPNLPTITPTSTASPTLSPTATNTATDTATPTQTTTASRTPAPFASMDIVEISQSYYSPFAMDISPDAQYVAVSDETVSIISMQNGRVIQHLDGGFDTLWAIAWSPDGQYIAAGGFGEELYIWDVYTAEMLVNEYLGDNVNAIEWSPDGQYVLAGTNSELYLYDMENGVMADSASQGAEHLSWSPDGSRILGVGFNDLQPYTINNGTIVGYSRLRVTDYDAPVATSPDSSKFALLSDNVLYLVDRTNNQTIWQASPVRGDGESVVFSPDGRYILTVTESEMAIWDVQTSEQVYQIRFSDTVYGGMWSPDGQYILTSDGDILRWTVPASLNVEPSEAFLEFASPTPRPTNTRQPTITPRPTNTPASDLIQAELDLLSDEYVASYDFDIAPDGSRYAVTDAVSRLITISVDDGSVERIGTLDENTRIIRWSPDGTYIAANYTDEGVRVFDVATGDVVFEESLTTFIADISWSPDSTFLAITELDQLTIWSLDDGDMITTLDFPASAVDWSADGNQIVVGGLDSVVLYAFDGDTFEEIREYDDIIGDDFIWQVAISPDNEKVAAVDFTGNLAVWTSLADNLQWADTRNFADIRGIWWSPDSTKLMVLTDTTITILDGTSGTALLQADSESTLFAGRWLPTGKAILVLDIYIQSLILPDELLTKE